MGMYIKYMNKSNAVQAYPHFEDVHNFMSLSYPHHQPEIISTQYTINAQFTQWNIQAHKTLNIDRRLFVSNKCTVHTVEYTGT